jgi:hypothetical protein
MRNISAAIFVVAVLSIVAFVAIGGSFDRTFWLNFLPGLMENLTALAVAIFIIERILAKGRFDKLAQANAAQSHYIFFLSNRQAYLLLNFLGLANQKEFSSDAELNFEFAYDRLKGMDLATTFYDKLMDSEDKQTFIEGFVEILREQHEGISKALDKIYPRPDPNLKSMHASYGMVNALAILPKSYKGANQEVREEDRLKPEHLDLLIKIGYPPVRQELKNIQEAIVELSEKASENKLFISFD